MEPTTSTEPTAPPAERVRVINPDGELGTIPRDQLDDAALEQGYSEATPQQIAEHEQEQGKGSYGDLRSRGLSPVGAGLVTALTPRNSSLGGYGAGIESGATFGFLHPGIAAALHAANPQWSDAYKQTIKRIEDASPSAETAGEVTGHVVRDVGLAAATGGAGSIAGVVGEAAEGTSALGHLAEAGWAGRAASKGLAAALGAGTEGAVYGATKELSEEAMGDADLNAEKIIAAGAHQGVMGALFGAGIGAGASLAKSGIGAALEAGTGALAKHADSLQGSANLQRWKALDPLKKYSEEVSARVKPLAGVEGSMGGAEGAGEVLKEYGVLGNDVRTIASLSRDDIADRISAAKQVAGKALGEVRAASPAVVRVGDIMDDFDKAIAKVGKDTDELGVRYGRASFVHKPVVASLEQMKQDLAESLGAVVPTRVHPDTGVPEAFAINREAMVPVQDVIAQRTFLNDKIYHEAKALDPNMRVKILRGFSADMNQRTITAIDEAAKAAGNRDVGPQLRKLARDYQVLSIAEKAADTTSARTVTNRNISLSGQIAGAAVMGSGHGLLALPAAMAHQWMKSHGNQIAALAYDKAAGLGMVARGKQLADESLAAAAKGLVGGEVKALPASRSVKDSLPSRYAAAVKHVAKISADPNAIPDATPPLDNAPKTSVAMTVAAARTLSYLNSRTPPSVVRPSLGGPDQEPRASVPDMQRFVRAYDVARTGGASALYEMSRGRLNREDVTALKAMSPKLFQELQQRALENVAAHKAAGKTLTHDQRLKLGILLDIPTDPSLERATLGRLQSSLTSQSSPDDQPDQQQNQAPQKPVNMKPEATGLDRIEQR